MISIKIDGAKTSMEVKGDALEVMAEAGVIFAHLRDTFKERDEDMARTFDMACLAIMSGALCNHEDETEEDKKNEDNALHNLRPIS